MSKFKVGDRVVVNECEAYSWLNGYCGTVVGYRGVRGCGIEFDESILDLFGHGHTCGGTAKDGHGFYLLDEWLGAAPVYVKLPDVTDLL